MRTALYDNRGRAVGQMTLHGGPVVLVPLGWHLVCSLMLLCMWYTCYLCMFIWASYVGVTFVTFLNLCIRFTHVCMYLPPDNVCKGIMFSGRPPATFIVCLFIRTRYHDISWTPGTILIKLTGNFHKPLLMTWLDSGGQRSRCQHAVKVAEASSPHQRWGVKVHTNVVVVSCWYMFQSVHCSKIYLGLPLSAFIVVSVLCYAFLQTICMFPLLALQISSL